MDRATARIWLQEPEARDTLTDREVAVVTLWTRENPVSAIAVALSVSRRGADKSLRRALDKLGRFARIAALG